jgi:hypothetical protein
MPRINNIVGVQLTGMSKGQLGALVGGSSGCTHLLSMLYNAAQILDATLKSDR